MGEPSYPNIRDQVDDFYISALSNGDKRHDLIPISDENYAMELQLQEVLSSSITVSPKPVKIAKEDRASSSSSQAGQLFCKICMETVPASELFKTSKACSHVFCRDCLSCYLGTEIQENIWAVRCPEENCKAVLEPGMCQELLPSEVFKRWESALCESMVLGAQKIHCPFKDCSALMLHDADETVTRSECPSCRRFFCAACKVAWHSGLSCEEVGKLGEDEKEREDLLMMQMAKEKKWRRCPRCKYFVEKKDGCLHITCRCRFEFCYGCGKMWDITHASCST
ncbi:RING/U-box superfamily protein [Rhynchospora pubera]|uniref:RBR-type E3 ubiquitin transferase n=1 Tax=Rhynchospora pubera TaxID=906938 RepID=A0AAV8BPL2_9POAL|nr:RING/U-box superfamily protein [Rhynchospora pubera]